MENKNTLNGFEAIFDSLVSNVGANKTNEDNEKDIVDGVSEELTDEELEALRNPKKNKKNEKEEIEEDNEEDLDDEEEEEEPAKPDTKKGKKKSESKDDKEDTKEEEYEDNDDSNDDKSEEVIVGFFDSLSEQLGWDDINDDEKPRTAEELIEYFKDVIEENSTPSYSSEEVEKLDEFVRNGGNLKDYFSIDADIDLDNIEVEDNEINQKLIVKEFLKEKGFSTKQIEKKITKYEDAGILEDEATDALEALKDIKAERKEKLLEQQQKLAREAEKQQQEFFLNVVSEIKGMNSIYGIDIPEKDKRALLEYIFKPDANGVTKYLKDYAKSLKNLITSAYFTMKGDSLITIAKQKGRKDALDNFKNSLRGNGVSKKSKKQIINNDSTSTIWDTFARQLRAA
ncbi:regulatory protein [uncultured phage cr125_1]|uniref:Regulatory protein n=1 Tax=uncultured phage cr125_1 TaxID=2772091 RepID=A0A7M1RTH0_9CAUD|nr:regulatory protein [uncultured phage cr125_1]QOR57566.1 regulatory protein [uncultured phage cr125_1]